VRWIALAVAIASACVSAYGWWSYLSIASDRGGLEVALGGGMLAAVALLVMVSCGGQRP